MAEFAFPTPCLITNAHQTATFDCGKAALNNWLQQFALANAQSGNSRTFVVADGEDKIVGYYSLSATSLEHDAAPQRVRQGQPRHPIPAILMARFAVHLNQQGQGLGRALFRDALLRSLNITAELGARTFVVDAKDEDARLFYSRFGRRSRTVKMISLLVVRVRLSQVDWIARKLRSAQPPKPRERQRWHRRVVRRHDGVIFS